MSLPAHVPAAPLPAGVEADDATTTVEQVWRLLGRADVIVRGCLEARDRAERRLWEERARVWLADVGQAWIRTPPR